MRTHIRIALFCLVGLMLIGCQDKSEKSAAPQKDAEQTTTEQKATERKSAEQTAAQQPTAQQPAAQVTAAAAWGTEIAPLLTADTAMVVRVDLANIDFDAAVKALDASAKKVGEENPFTDAGFNESRQKIDEIKQAGAKAIFVLATPDMSGESPLDTLTAVTLNDNANLATLAKLFDVELVRAGTGTPPADVDEWTYKYETVAAEHKGLLLLAPRAMLDRVVQSKPVARPELNNALAASGGATIAVAVIPPRSQVQQLLESAPPTLPEELGGGKTDSLGKIEWISLGIGLPPATAITVTVKCESADVAKDLKTMIDAMVPAIETILEAIAANKNTAAGDNIEMMLASVGLKVVKDLNLQAKGDTITGRLDDKQITDTIDRLMPVIADARAMAKMAGSGMNLANMGKTIAIYMAGNDDQFPPTLETLLEDGSQSPLMFVNPRGLGATPEYVYIFPKHGWDQPSNIMVYENYVTWPKHGIYYLRVDLAVLKIENETAFKKLLAESTSDE